MAEALRTPQRVEWMDAINKEMSFLVDKDVYEVRKLPVGRKLIHTKLVLKIKLASYGSIDKYKARCVVTGNRQTAGLDLDAEGVYSPMAQPIILRLVLTISRHLKLNIDLGLFSQRRESRERAIVLLASTRFQSARWHGMAHQERPVQSTPIRIHMGKDLPRLDA